MIVTPDFGVMAYSQVEDMHPQQHSLLRGLYHLPAVIARLRTRHDFIAVAAGPFTINQAKVEKLTLWFDSTATTLALDPASGKVVAAFFRDRGKGGAIGAIEMRCIDWRDINGLTLPASAEAWFNNERWEAGDLKPDTLAVNNRLRSLRQADAQGVGNRTRSHAHDQCSKRGVADSLLLSSGPAHHPSQHVVHVLRVRHIRHVPRVLRAPTSADSSAG